MKNWQEIYNKYKDSELMKGFYEYCLLEGFFRFRGGIVCPRIDGNLRGCFPSLKIKDIWGYLMCFAETKRQLNMIMIQFGYDINHSKKKYTIEESMCRCADKFFEVA